MGVVVVVVMLNGLVMVLLNGIERGGVVLGLVWGWAGWGGVENKGWGRRDEGCGGCGDDGGGDDDVMMVVVMMMWALEISILLREIFIFATFSQNAQNSLWKFAAAFFCPHHFEIQPTNPLPKCLCTPLLVLRLHPRLPCSDCIPTTLFFADS